MTSNAINNTAAIILAAGRGKRMQLDGKNKVTVHMVGKPLILHVVDFMQHLGINTIIVVVGHSKESVIEELEGKNIIFVEQKEQLGTGHAVEEAIKALPEHITDVVVAYGDDAVLYVQKHFSLAEQLLDLHNQKHDAITLLTLEQEDPFGMGRIVRDASGNIQSIVEEKDATDEQRNIKEINPGHFIFSVDFLKKYLPRLSKSSLTGEYYLTSLVEMAVTHGEQVDSVQGGKITWRGVNTLDDLKDAEKLYNEKTPMENNQ